MEKIRIGVLTHGRQIQNKFEHLKKLCNCELVFKVGVLDYAIEKAEKLEKTDKVDAIIATAATAAIVSDYINIPVIPLHLRNENLLHAVYEATQISNYIAFADINKTVFYNLDMISNIFQCDIKRYPFNDLSETNQIVKQAAQDGRDVMVTQANCMYSAAVENNLSAVLVSINTQDIIDAIKSARNILTIRKQDEEKNKWMTAVVNNSTEGIITIDTKKRITLVNDMVSRLLHLPPEELIGQNVQKLAEKHTQLQYLLGDSEEFKVVKAEDQQFIVNRCVVSSNYGPLGEVIRISTFNELQKTELRARKYVNANGFIAQYRFEDIVGVSRILTDVKHKAFHYAQSSATILILGESGSGKEIFAQSIHNASPRADRPFIALNCTTLTESLLDSELFGYEDGAFTGAKKGGASGLFEMAHGGTMFLDEIGDMPLQLQVKLLRVLQEKIVRRLGGHKNIPIDVRMIFATNRDLLNDVRGKNFREDLYYRINVLALKIPPLRSCKEDIPELVKSLISNHVETTNMDLVITSKQFEQMQRYPWPGNVRELSNLVDRIVALSISQVISSASIDNMLEEMMEDVRQDNIAEQLQTDLDGCLVVPIGSMREIELSVIQQIYTRCGGVKKEVEKILDMSTTTIWRRFREISDIKQ